MTKTRKSLGNVRLCIPFSPCVACLAKGTVVIFPPVCLGSPSCKVSVHLSPLLTCSLTLEPHTHVSGTELVLSDYEDKWTEWMDVNRRLFPFTEVKLQLKTAILAVLFIMFALRLICLARGVPSHSNILVKFCLSVKSIFKNVLLPLYFFFFLRNYLIF